MKKGGYTLIDCKGLNLLAQSAQTIPGLYNKVKTAMNANKLIRACGCVYGAGKPLSPIDVFALQEAADTIICTASILQVIVKNDDTVTIANLDT